VKLNKNTNTNLEFARVIEETGMTTVEKQTGVLYTQSGRNTFIKGSNKCHDTAEKILLAAKLNL